MKNDIAALDKITDLVLGYVKKPSAAKSAASPTSAPEFTFYEFFAGGGMARAGLGLKWKCLFANDFDFKKSVTYNDNWGTINSVLLTKDVGKVEVKDLPGTPSLVWASFPCQDLSLAGMGAGLKGDRSGAFWPFWQLIKKLSTKKRGPQISGCFGRQRVQVRRYRHRCG